MNNNKNIFSKYSKLEMIVLIVGIIISFLLVNGNIKISDSNTDLFIIASVILTVIAVAIGIFNSIMILKNRKSIKQSILESVLPRNAIVVDFLIYKKIKYKRNELDDFQFSCFPIIKDLENNKLYVSLTQYDYSKYLFYYKYYTYKPLECKLKNMKGNQITIGDCAKYFLNREIGKFNIIENKLSIEDNYYTYFGKIYNSTLMEQKGDNLLFNVHYDNALDLLRDVIVFEGIIDFENLN